MVTGRKKSESETPATEAADDAGFCARLKAAREERAFTQGAVALRTKGMDPEGRGVSRTAIISYEQGTSKPGIRELRLLCEVLHVTPNWLIYGTDSAARAALPSREMLSNEPALRDLFKLTLALLALKGHERDSLLTLALSLAGRQLGDSRLSAVMMWGVLLANSFAATLKAEIPELPDGATLEELADWLADEGAITNAGNRFRHSEDGDVLNPEVAVYPDPPKRPKSRKS